jgi:hypothetical protein
MVLKIIMRVFLILLAAALVGGAVFTIFNQNPSLTANLNRPGERFEPSSQELNPPQPAAFPSQRGFEDEELSGRFFSAFAWLNVLFKLVIVAGITLVVLLIQKMVGGLQRQFGGSKSRVNQ